jgi:hypothetical protein
MRQAAVAATIGIPAGVKGMRTSAMAPPARAAMSARLDVTCVMRRARKRAGKAASRP